MAASKKKTNPKQSKTPAKRGRPPKQSAPQRAPRPDYSREIGAAVCLLLALCIIVSYFGTQAIFLVAFSQILRGLIGAGYWLAGPALAVAGVNLLRHRDRKVTLRTVSTLAAPVVVGVLGHVLFCPHSFALGAKMFAQLWASAQGLPSCGGALSGAVATAMVTGFGAVVTGILFAALLALCLVGAFHISPQQVAGRVKEKHAQYQTSRAQRAEERSQEPEEKPTEALPPRRQRPVIDLPVDDAPVAAPEAPAEEKPRRKGFFQRRSDDVLTPDQVLTNNASNAQNPVMPPVVMDTPEPPAEPEKRKKKVSAQELEAAANEVSRAIEEELAEGEEAYRYPPTDLLEENKGSNHMAIGEELRDNAQRLSSTLQSFGVTATPGEVIHGPSVTRYEFTLAEGVKLSRLTNLADDIALALGASGVRIAPVPNKISVVGIEVPNRTVTMVRIREVIESRNFHNHTSPVAFALGKDIGGNCIVSNLAKLPHVLIGGTTGSGKSVCTNSLIVSLLYRSTPEEVRFIMVDPKMVELAPYNGIPHLLIPVVTDPKKAAGALQWAVFEMMKRYKMFSENGVKDLAGYNALSETDEEIKKLPNVVVVIDELADLMLVAAKEVEESICRVAQMGRAAGMHLVIATQRPSADVITGLMKANIPSRIALSVASSLESRIILDTPGAEKLIGNGDMLYSPVGSGKPSRVQGCFISPAEIEQVVAFVKETGEADYSEEVMQKIEEAMRQDDKGGKAAATDPVSGEECDELFPAAVEVVLETGQASVSMLQRRLKLGYSRAARLVDQMEERGIVGPFEGSKPRQLLIDRAKWQELQMAKAQPEPTFDRYGSIRDVFDPHDALE